MSAHSSSTFWSLIDRLHVPDDQALELVAYDGKLPTTGRRPRFKLSPEQERIVSTLVPTSRRTSRNTWPLECAQVTF
jgi:hypothetical protein